MSGFSGLTGGGGWIIPSLCRRRGGGDNPAYLIIKHSQETDPEARVSGFHVYRARVCIRKTN